MPDAARERWVQLTELLDLRTTIGEDHLRERLMVFGRVQESLARLRDVRSTEAMIRRAPAEVALACDMDRVVIYRIDGGMMVAEAFHIAGDEERAAGLLAYSREHPAPLNEQILEREMLRRRRPIVVRDAQNHPASYKPFVTRYDTHAYVAAPIMPEGRVIGFLHADKGLRHPRDPRGVDELDRDALWAFAEGFGYAVERMQLLERLRAQSDEVRSLISRTESVVAEHMAAQVELASGPHGDAAAARAAAALLPRGERPGHDAHAARARGARPDRRRRDERPDRRSSRDQREHRQIARQADPAQARRRQPRRGGVDVPQSAAARLTAGEPSPVGQRA